MHQRTAWAGIKLYITVSTSVRDFLQIGHMVNRTCFANRGCNSCHKILLANTNNSFVLFIRNKKGGKVIARVLGVVSNDLTACHFFNYYIRNHAQLDDFKQLCHLVGQRHLLKNKHKNISVIEGLLTTGNVDFWINDDSDTVYTKNTKKAPPRDSLKKLGYKLL